ncbi:hypothetical protein KO489_00520 [Reinekea forsetii]|nr:hypothetical protein [Reinekea forsetii]
MLRILSFFAASIFMLTACVDIPDDVDTSLNDKPTTITGVFSVDAPGSATVRLFSYEDGVKGAVLAETTTFEDGSFTFEMTASSQPMLIEATEGSFRSPITGRQISMGSYAIRTLFNFEAGKDSTIAVTPFTNIAAGLTQYKVNSDSQQNLKSAISESNEILSELYSIDIINVLPCNLSTTACQGSDSSYSYSIALAAWSNLANELCTNASCDDTTRQYYSSTVLADFTYRDIAADGFLDGMFFDSAGVIPTRIYLGTTEFSPLLYRNQFAQSLLRMVTDNSNEEISVEWETALAFAQQVNNSDLSIFNSEPPVAIDNESPSLTYQFKDGDAISGEVELDFTATDNITVVEVSYSLNSVEYPISNIASPTISFNSETFADGETEITLIAVDAFGNKTEEAVMLRIANYSPIVTLLSPALVKNSNYTLEIEINENGVDVDEVQINGTVVDSSNLSSIERNLTLSKGNSVNTVTVIDINSLTYDYNFTIGLDNQAPTVSVTSPGDNAPNIYNAQGNLVKWQPIEDSNQVLNITRDTIALDGLNPSAETLKSNNLAFVEFTVKDPEANGLKTDVNDLTVKVKYTKNGSVVFNNKTINHDDGYVIFALVNENLLEGWADHPTALNQKLEFSVEDSAGNITVYELDYLAALKTIDTSNSLIDERYYNQILNVDLNGDLSETVSSTLKIGNQTSILNDTLTSNRLIFDTTAVNDGRYEATVSITGLFDNTDSEKTFIRIDNTPPTLSNIQFPEFTNLTSATITGNAFDAGIGLDSFTVDNTEVQVNPENATFSTTKALNAGDKQYDFSLSAVDYFGQEVNESISVTLDTVKPDVTITGGINSTWSRDPTRTVSGSCTDTSSGVSSVNVSINGETESATCSGGSYSRSFSSIANGTHSISATATDNAGNEQSTTKSNVVRIDTAAPSIGVTGGTSSTWSKIPTRTVSGTCSDAHSGVSTINVSINGQNKTATCTGGTFAGAFTSIADGTHSITTTITDHAGNSKDVTNANAVRIDTNSPVASIDSSVSGWITSSSKTVTGSCSDSGSGVSTVNVQLGNTSKNTSCSGGRYSSNFGSLTNGNYTVKTTVTDQASNQISRTVSNAVKVDLTAPTLSGLSSQFQHCNMGFGGSCQRSQVFNITAQDLESGITSLTKTSGSSCTLNGTKLTCTTTVYECFETSIVSSTIKATNSAGNSTSKSASFRLTATCDCDGELCIEP